MAAPTQPLIRTETVTLANPTPPTNIPVNYQGSPPTPVGLSYVHVNTTPENADVFADPLNGAVATQWTGTDAKPVVAELAGKAEAEGTEVTTVVGGTTGHSTTTSVYSESPNASHPSSTGTNPVGSELVTGGDFADATGWTLSGLATIGTGTLNMGGGANSTAGRAAAATLTTGNYQFEFDVTTTDGTGQVSVIIGGVPLVVAGSQAVGHYTGIITTDAASQLLQLRCITAVICKLDNFSVKRLL
jgi:hypothetical protein